MRYHDNLNRLRFAIGRNKDEIIDAMLEDRYSVTFVIPMPESWSRKKKAEQLGEYHRQTPDLDNLEKALKDCLFYEHPVHNDCEVATAHESKIWGETGMIIVDTIE